MCIQFSCVASDRKINTIVIDIVTHTLSSPAFGCCVVVIVVVLPRFSAQTKLVCNNSESMNINPQSLKSPAIRLKMIKS